MYQGVKPEGIQALSANRDQQQRCHLGISSPDVSNILLSTRCLES